MATLAPVAGWTETVVSLAAYAGQANLKLRWTYDDNADWGSGLAIDDVETYVPADDNVRFDGLFFNLAPGAQVSVKVTNMGGNDLTSFDVNYILNGTAGTKSISQTITPGNTATIALTGVTIPEMAGQNISATIVNVNGGVDSDPSDNDDEILNFNADNLVAATVPDFELSDSHGNIVNLHQMLANGTYVVLDFMASWCGPCQSSTPELNTIWVNNGSTAGGDIEVLAITVEAEDDNAVVNALAWGGNYPKIAYSEMNDDLYGYYNGLFGSGGIPLFIGICPNVSDPGNSTVTFDQVGWSPGVFTPLQTAINVCNPASVEENSFVSQLNVYPNPINNSATVSFNLNGNDNTTVQVVSTSGQIVKTINLGNVGGLMQLNIDFTDVEAGMYILNVNVGGSINTTSVTVTK